MLEIDYAVRRTSEKEWAVVSLCPYTHDIAEYISFHNNPANASRRALALEDKSYRAELAAKAFLAGG